ncbi:MAG TPA: AraC family transcriptional regulator [Puia sp.]|nr:AraC family transcriptional regulator [Puia sp.]
MENYYKYLPVSEEDESWGLCVLNAGCSRVRQDEEYPAPGHPRHHYFDWNDGRILHDEYQVIYITRGEGVFESASTGVVPVKEGSVLLLFPNEWHRFRPNKDKGWNEYWVGFHGKIADNLVSADFFHPGAAAFWIGVKEEILQSILEILDQTKKEESGYQPRIAGAVLHLLGKIHSLRRQHYFRGETHMETIVNKGRFLIRECFESNLSIEDIAQKLNVSYSSFRKIFKKYTGMSPGQYMIQLKIDKARQLLSQTDKSIKEISFELNFSSGYYFSTLFKKKTGCAPENYRKEVLTRS